MQTLLLSVDNWDLTLDASGNIATASEPYALAQDVASACKVFAGELWYDTTQGIPYLENILGQSPPLQYIKSQLEDAALTVPGVVSALCVLAGLNGRLLSGQIQIIDITGATTNVQF
jgi:hypothetical protein